MPEFCYHANHVACITRIFKLIPWATRVHMSRTRNTISRMRTGFCSAPTGLYRLCLCHQIVIVNLELHILYRSPAPYGHFPWMLWQWSSCQATKFLTSKLHSSARRDAPEQPTAALKAQVMTINLLRRSRTGTESAEITAPLVTTEGRDCILVVQCYGTPTITSHRGSCVLCACDLGHLNGARVHILQHQSIQSISRTWQDARI
ncbi:hypothetical protein DEU56DRAFT_233540 [Suillus clintonianus]|uniref:uncharacterized protein n=1 Tax=Suillus clintonianus TaxID=1904413 RepID=UPI001B869CCF|nr:uncharacterized protein DEU56DRAFT_233540 [Suillus clintonianus]KAG2156387.1 hypothetical protein DEU56DRAFT_233540 [Suillus clintonianus]